MRVMKVSGVIGLAIGLTIGATAAAQTEEPDGVEIMKAMAQAVSEAGALTFDASFQGVGSLSVQVPRGSVRATLAPGEDGDARWRYRADGWLLRPKTVERQAFAFGFDGKAVRCLDEQAKEVIEAGAGQEDDTVVHDAARPLRWMWRWNDFVVEPFGMEEVTYPTTWLGRTAIGEVDCDIVRVDYSERADVEELDLFWYVSTDDHLPRRIEATYFFGDGSGLGMVNVSNFERSTVIAAGAFTIEPPDGYEVNDGAGAQAQANQPAGGVPVGDPAPAWKLLDAAGDEHTLEAFRGKVVLMDFWAKWCGPCRAVMPGIQKLHEEFGEQGLVAVGVHCWDDPEAGAAYMKEQGFTYTSLFNGDDVATAYGVNAIPTFYLIGPDGRVEMHQVGGGGHAALKAKIEALLPDEGG